MKKGKPTDKQGILAITTFVVLALLMMVQISWIFRAARLEEQNFNHRVSMALKAARDEIGVRAPKCTDMSDFLCGRQCPEHVNQSKHAEVDSIIRANLSMYNIALPYTFEITDSLLHQSRGRFFNPTCYQQNLNGLIDQNGIQIRVLFPTRNQYLIGQLYSQLGLSILFILFVMLSFLITWRLFRREKDLMLHTTDFINNMVHEFQTPIANIRFAANLLKKKKTGDSPQKTEEYTEVILNETLRLQGHVEAILKVASHSDNQDSTEKIDMHQMIEHVISTFHFRLEHAQAAISLDARASKHEINAEWGPLTLIISNLIDNALKYVSHQPQIHISTQNKENLLVVSVQDNGIGIRKEDQSRIFDKFFRVSTGNVHDVKGFGLGLTYVKKVVEQFGGHVTVQSTPGKGSIFTLTFPLIDSHVNTENNSHH
ncbi:sensor histidine kinase [Geofilum rubicundum]|nr:HAMP domain-containing sensor histidine kinase [Geofilum rubicundum]